MVDALVDYVKEHAFTVWRGLTDEELSAAQRRYGLAMPALWCDVLRRVHPILWAPYMAVPNWRGAAISSPLTLAQLPDGVTQHKTRCPHSDYPSGNVPFWSELHAWSKLGDLDERFGRLAYAGQGYR